MHFHYALVLFLAQAFDAVGAAESCWSAPVSDRSLQVYRFSAAQSGTPALGAAATPDLRNAVDQLGKGVFLIASEKLIDPNFSQTVVLLIEYDDSGALGLIINRPSGVALAQALPEVESLATRQDTVFFGGPVGRNQLFLLVRSPQKPAEADLVIEDVYASISLETLRQVLSDRGAEAEFHAHAGYSGWGPGQLDNEVLRGDWYITPADALTIFEQPSEDIWPNLIKKHRGVWVFRMPAGPELSRVSFDSGLIQACR